MGIYEGKDIQRGFIDERRVIDWMLNEGHDIRLSTQDQNVNEDIDFFVWRDGRWVGISVKSVGERFHCFGVETLVEVKDWNNPDKPTWIADGAFMWCKAEFYIMVHGNKLYEIDKSKLDLKKAESHKWLTWKIKQRQLENRHPNIDARCSLFPLSDLLLEGTAKLIGCLHERKKPLPPVLKRKSPSTQQMARKGQQII